MTRSIRRSTIVLGMAVAVASAACGGGSGTAAPGGSASAATQAPAATSGGAQATSPVAGVSACDLLSDGRIADLTGFTVTAKTDVVADTTYPVACRWSFEETASNLDLGLLPSGGADFLKRTIEFEGGAEEIPGLADRTVRLEASRVLVTLFGDALLELQLVGVTDEDEVDLMRAAVSSLRG